MQHSFIKNSYANRSPALAVEESKEERHQDLLSNTWRCLVEKGTCHRACVTTCSLPSLDAMTKGLVTSSYFFPPRTQTPFPLSIFLSRWAPERYLTTDYPSQHIRFVVYQPRSHDQGCTANGTTDNSGVVRREGVSICQTPPTPWHDNQCLRNTATHGPISNPAIKLVGVLPVTPTSKFFLSLGSSEMQEGPSSIMVRNVKTGHVAACRVPWWPWCQRQPSFAHFQICLCFMRRNSY